MKNESLKVAVVFNEANPDFYIKPAAEKPKELNFVPFFEVDETTPIEEYEILAKLLCEAGYIAYTLNIMDDVNLLIKDVRKNKPDLIFNFVELYGENSRYEMNSVGIIELLRVPYTGAPPMALANCQNKVLAKRILKQNGIRTPEFILIEKPEETYKHNLNYPLIVKPAFEDASVGIENDSIVKNGKELKQRVDYIFFNFSQSALVEEFIDGRELNVAVLGYNDPKALPISEIDFTEMPGHLHNIVSYQAKWDPMHEAYHKTIPVCPAILPKAVERKAHEIALRAFKIMGCRDYARVDMRLSKDNELYVLEVNPNPDLTEGAGFMRSAEAAGYPYVEALKAIINSAVERSRK